MTASQAAREDADSARTFILDRMEAAPQRVRERLDKATRILERAGLEHAVIVGNAVAAWVGSVNPGAVRFTQEVDILVFRAEWQAVRTAMEAADFVFRHVRGVDLFLDPPVPGRPPRAVDAVHIRFGGERVKPGQAPNPLPSRVTRFGSLRVLDLPELVRMKLNASRLKDWTHLQDMVNVGLVTIVGIRQAAASLPLGTVAERDLARLEEPPPEFLSDEPPPSAPASPSS